MSDVEHDVRGTYRLIKPALSFSETPASVRLPAPLVGQQTTTILAELGYPAEEVRLMIEGGAVRQSTEAG